MDNEKKELEQQLKLILKKKEDYANELQSFQKEFKSLSENINQHIFSINDLAVSENRLIQKIYQLDYSHLNHEMSHSLKTSLIEKIKSIFNPNYVSEEKNNIKFKNTIEDKVASSYEKKSIKEHIEEKPFIEPSFVEQIMNEDWPLLDELENTRFALKNRKSSFKPKNKKKDASITSSLINQVELTENQNPKKIKQEEIFPISKENNSKPNLKTTIKKESIIPGQKKSEPTIEKNSNKKPMIEDTITNIAPEITSSSKTTTRKNSTKNPIIEDTVTNIAPEITPSAKTTTRKNNTKNPIVENIESDTKNNIRAKASTRKNNAKSLIIEDAKIDLDIKPAVKTSTKKTKIKLGTKKEEDTDKNKKTIADLEETMLLAKKDNKEESLKTKSNNITFQNLVDIKPIEDSDSLDEPSTKKEGLILWVKHKNPEYNEEKLLELHANYSNFLSSKFPNLSSEYFYSSKGPSFKLALRNIMFFE